MSEKPLGYGLLGLGLLIMIIALVYTFLVFTGNRKPPQVFSIEAPKIDLNTVITAGLPQGMNVDLPKNELQVIPNEDFNKIINMSTTLFLMGFIVTFGFKLASLGTMLIRPVKVTLKEAAPSPNPTTQ